MNEQRKKRPDNLNRGRRFDDVQKVCEEFAQSWDLEVRPQISDFVNQIDPNRKEILLRNLLHFEIAKRRGNGEDPQETEYRDQLPDDADVISQVFLESRSFSMKTGETATEQTMSFIAPAASRLGAYVLEGELGRGGMGVVYKAMHSKRGNRVALKTLPEAEGVSLHSFKREFRALADISHPNLVGLHSLETDGEHWFFTMDLIDGQNFLKYVRPGGRLDEQRLRGALSQLVAGISALHRNKIIHRDLKPSNVMVDGDGKLALLDFGLVAETHQRNETMSLDRLVGTPAYMAPEQAVGQKVTPSADWYAVGVMLYEALSGQRPFQGGMLEILQAKRQQEAPSLPEDPKIPPDLVELCMGLLARHPDDRIGLVQLETLLGEERHVDPKHGPSTPQELVGREEQMVQLEQAFRDFSDKEQPLTIFVSGRSGEGKTVLTEKFFGQIKFDSRLVLISGRCYDRESVPFKALDSLVDGLCSYLRSLEGQEAALLIPREIGLLAKLFPVLHRVDAVAAAPKPRIGQLDDQEVRSRAFAALRELLVRISDRTAIIAFIDDLQWGDADSAEVLFEVLQPPESPLVMFLGTFRSDEAAGSPFLNKWAQLQQQADEKLNHIDVRVEPLSEKQCIDLFVNRLGRDNATIREVARKFVDETGGNPFLLSELIDNIDEDDQSLRPLPLNEVIERKLSQLPAASRKFLDVISVSGQAIAVDEALEATKDVSFDVSLITSMRKERLVRIVGAEFDGKVDTYHDKIRETVLTHMTGTVRKQHHLVLANTIEKQLGGALDEFLNGLNQGEIGEAESVLQSGRVYDLAYHFDLAEQQQRALGYSILGAEQAKRQFSPEVVAEQFEISQRNSGNASNKIKFRINEGLGEAWMLLGQYERARETLNRAHQLADATLERANVEYLQAETSIKQGKLDEGRVVLEKSLRSLGFWIPRTRFGLMLGLGKGVAVQAGHTLFPRRLHRKIPNPRAALAARMYSRLNHVDTFQNTFRWMWSTVTGLNLAERYPSSYELGFAYGIHGMLLTMLGWFGNRGKRYAEKGIKIATEMADYRLLAQCKTYEAISKLATGQYDAGLQACNESIEGNRKVGEVWEGNLARFHLACCHFQLGELDLAINEAQQTFESSANTNDSRTMCSSWIWARATGGDIPFDKLRACIPIRPDDVMSTVHALLAESHWYGFHGEFEKALKLCERATALVRNSGCVNSHTILVLPMLAKACRERAIDLATSDIKSSRNLLKRAGRLAKWATRITWLIPVAYPVSLRERSLCAFAVGKMKPALRFAELSCKVAHQQNARYEFAQSNLLRAKLKNELGISGEEELEQATRSLASFTDLVSSTGSGQNGICEAGIIVGRDSR